ncbi:MAG: hypothetical protein U1E52_09150 [Geminicoccaceae bacterium]
MIAFAALLVLGLQLQVRLGTGVAGASQRDAWQREHRQANLRRLGIDLASSTAPVLR